MSNTEGGFLRFIRDVVMILVAAVVISFLIKTFLFRSFYIPSESMEDTLLVDDRIIVNMLVPEVSDINRGDVVVFEDPGNWLPEMVSEPSGFSLGSVLSAVGFGADNSTQHLIKRVIGLPGDHIVCESSDAPITINGVAIDETYLAPGATSCTDSRVFDVTVPEGSIWLMGDNRQQSADSSAHQDLPGGGTVSISQVVGRAFVISWPVNRWSGLDNHSEVFEDVPASSLAG